MFVQHEMPRVGNMYRCDGCGREVPCGSTPRDKLIEPALMNYRCPTITDQQRDHAVRQMEYEMVYAANIGRGRAGRRTIKEAWDALFA